MFSDEESLWVGFEQVRRLVHFFSLCFNFRQVIEPFVQRDGV